MLSLWIQFVIYSAIVCVAGVYVTKTTVKISKEINLSDALGGLIILAIVTNLPEIAIMTASAIRGELEIGISNILGGIAMQTVVICLFDFFRVDKDQSFTKEASSNQMIVEGLLVILILSLVMMGHYLPPSFSLGRIPLIELLVVSVWVMGLVVISHDRRSTSSKTKSIGVLGHLKQLKMDKTFVIFLISSGATLWAGYTLEEVSSKLALDLGMTGIVFGATILAFVTSLPEISTGLDAVFLKRDRLALSDIFGGNSFLPCLFLPAAIYVGSGIIPLTKKEDMYLMALSIVLTVLYTSGLTLKSKRLFLGIGYDMLAVLLFYGVGMVGLIWL